MSPATSATPEFHERLLPGPAALATVLGLGLLCVVTLVPLHPAAAGIAGVAVAAGGVAWLVLGAPVLAVRDGVLHAGRAHAPLTALGKVTPVLSRDAMREELRGRLDARAYVVLRSWIPTGVRVVVDDAHDPTPYWLLSTRRPHELAAALGPRGTRGETPGPDTHRAATPEV